MIQVGSSTSSMMVILDDKKESNKDDCKDNVIAVSEVNNYRTLDDLTPVESFTVIGIFLFVVFFLIFVLPFMDN